MPYRPNATTLAALAVVLGMGTALALGAPAAARAQAPEAQTLRARLAGAILASDRIALERDQPCPSPPGPCVEHDGATPYANIADTARGLPARTSPWADAAGRRVFLSPHLLGAMLGLQAIHTYAVSSIAGGDHIPESLHYQGQAVDVWRIDGVSVLARWERRSPHDLRVLRSFMGACAALGAVEVIGPITPGFDDHRDHIHCGWAA
jgi:hypothetical protein